MCDFNLPLVFARIVPVHTRPVARLFQALLVRVLVVFALACLRCAGKRLGTNMVALLPPFQIIMMMQNKKNHLDATTHHHTTSNNGTIILQ